MPMSRHSIKCDFFFFLEGVTKEIKVIQSNCEGLFIILYISSAINYTKWPKTTYGKGNDLESGDWTEEDMLIV